MAAQQEGEVARNKAGEMLKPMPRRRGRSDTARNEFYCSRRQCWSDAVHPSRPTGGRGQNIWLLFSFCRVRPPHTRNRRCVASPGLDADRPFVYSPFPFARQIRRALPEEGTPSKQCTWGGSGPGNSRRRPIWGRLGAAQNEEPGSSRIPLRNARSCPRSVRPRHIVFRVSCVILVGILGVSS